MPIEPTRPHIHHRYDVELENIRNDTLAMGGLVEKQFSDALQALTHRLGELGESVISSDEQVNAMELAIDEQCTQVLARRAPTASDLRLVLTVIKTINDLERIGDEIKDVARVALILSQGRLSKQVPDLGHMAHRVKRMLRKSLDAFARLDVSLAREITDNDVDVDRDYDAIMRQLLTYMMEDSRHIPEVLQLCWMARALERIGDRCRNIGEYVVFLVKGMDIRHSGPGDFRS
jgi:phosphate transport system protein